VAQDPLIVRRKSLTRRDFCTIGAGGVASIAFGSACRSLGDSMNDGRLTARPQPGVTTTPGDRILVGADSGDSNRTAILQLPKTEKRAPLLPLLVMLHGATQNAEDMFWYLGSAPDETGVAVLAPNSRDTTWDAISGSFAEDVAYLNRMLEGTFKLAAIDPARVAVGGFSDGASYAISLGLINGDLFRSVIAFSPGFVVEGTPEGTPRFFISHGTRDHILPIDRCGRRIASRLKARGYDVTFREFDGHHEIPSDVVREGLRFL
jgi:phospholipase/carboxylesterase